MALTMGITRLASQTIGENAVKTFITIVNAIFQVCAVNSEIPVQNSSERRERRERKGHQIFSGLNSYAIVRELVKIGEKISKIREIHLFGT